MRRTAGRARSALGLSGETRGVTTLVYIRFRYNAPTRFSYITLRYITDVKRGVNGREGRWKPSEKGT